MKGFPADFYSTFIYMLGLFFLSIAGFGFYRIYFGFMLLHTHGKYFFYDSGELPDEIITTLKKRGRPHENWDAHVIPGIIWIALTLILVYFWLNH